MKRIVGKYKGKLLLLQTLQTLQPVKNCSLLDMCFRHTSYKYVWSPRQSQSLWISLREASSSINQYHYQKHHYDRHHHHPHHHNHHHHRHYHHHHHHQHSNHHQHNHDHRQYSHQIMIIIKIKFIINNIIYTTSTSPSFVSFVGSGFPASMIGMILLGAREDSTPDPIQRWKVQWCWLILGKIQHHFTVRMVPVQRWLFSASELWVHYKTPPNFKYSEISGVR